MMPTAQRSSCSSGLSDEPSKPEAQLRILPGLSCPYPRGNGLVPGPREPGRPSKRSHTDTGATSSRRATVDVDKLRRAGIGELQITVATRRNAGKTWREVCAE